MTEESASSAPTLPVVDHPEVAEALRLVADLDDHPLEVHHERLTRAHEALHAVLQPGPAAG